MICSFHFIYRSLSCNSRTYKKPRKHVEYVCLFSFKCTKLDLFFSLKYFYGFKKIFREIKMSEHDLIKGFNLRNTLYKAEQQLESRERLTTMCPSQAFLWSCLVSLTTTESSAFLLNDHANASVGHPDTGNYNIYSKIDALERTLQNLETNVREKTTHSDTLMRQVLLTVTEMEVKMKTSDFQLQNMGLQIETLQNSSGNINTIYFIKYQLLLLFYKKKICVFYQYI